MNSDALAYLAEKGLSLAEIVEFARISERKADPTNAARQARHRAKRKGKKEDSVTRYSNGVIPPIDITHTPSVLISPDGENEHSERADKPNPFPKPDWADAEVWRDFMGNRKAKKARNTATAYRQFLADIDRLTDDEWPPPRLLEHATARGWAGIYDPRGNRSHERHDRNIPQSAGSRGERRNPCLDMLYQAEAEIRAGENQDADSPTWLALRAV